MSAHQENHPHAAGELLHAGAPLESASGAVILLHGRGATAGDILSLAPSLDAEGLAFVAPQAVGRAWYPESFLSPRERNEPWLSSALRRVEEIVLSLEAAGIPRRRVALAGFSQGACLATEFVASHPARYAALVAFTGGLIGPLGSDLRHEGSLDDTPALLSSGDPDPHVPWLRVEESAAELRRMHAEVIVRRYLGRPHTVAPEEIRDARALLQQAFR